MLTIQEFQSTGDDSVVSEGDTSLSRDSVRPSDERVEEADGEG